MRTRGRREEEYGEGGEHVSAQQKSSKSQFIKSLVSGRGHKKAGSSGCVKKSSWNPHGGRGRDNNAMEIRFSLNMRDLWERLLRSSGKFLRTLSSIWMLKSSRRKLVGFPVFLISLFVLLQWATQSNSCALNAFFCLIAFDVLTLFGDLLSHIYMFGGKPSTTYSFGFVRVEVLAHFSVLCLGLLLNVWALKNSLELISRGSNQEIHTGRFIPSLVVGGAIHFFLSFHNNPFLKVFKAAALSTTLQKYFQGICASFGLSLSSSSIFSHSPFAILGLFTCSNVFLLSFALQNGPRWFDLIGGLLIIVAAFDTLWPLSVYIGQVLLQTVPNHIVTQLEKSLHEALTIDGVLEFRNELFWTLTYGQIAGTLHVRVRRDANEQVVLSKIFNKLQPLAPHLTVQVTKDDFGRPFSNLHILRDVDSPLTKITIGSTSELSPISNSSQMNDHSIYSVSSTYRDYREDGFNGQGQSRYPIPGLNESSIHYPSQIRPSLTSVSSMYQNNNVPTQITANTTTATPSDCNAISTSTPRPQISPFVSTSSSSNAQTISQNLLISSANDFPEV